MELVLRPVVPLAQALVIANSRLRISTVRTYPLVDEKSGLQVAFEIELAYASPSMVAGVLSTVAGVTEVKVRRPFSKWEDIHIWFRYQDVDCVVLEPFGDNSRFWIGPKKAEEAFDIHEIENAFKDYQLPLYRRVIGDVLSFRFLRWLVRPSSFTSHSAQPKP